MMNPGRRKEEAKGQTREGREEGGLQGEESQEGRLAALA